MIIFRNFQFGKNKIQIVDIYVLIPVNQTDYRVFVVLAER